MVEKLERKVKTMTEEFNDEKQGLSSWLADNLRIIISVIIVILIAGSIFSYSKRSEDKVAINDKQEEMTDEEMLSQILKDDQEDSEEAEDSSDDEEVIVENAEEDTKIKEDEAQVIEEVEEEETEVPAPEENQKPDQKQEIAATQNINREKEGSFVETAESGDGITHLSRKALNDYLKNNPDSDLSKEHKIYIEDYLRKKIGFQGGMHVGTSVEFSKNLIEEAIDSSKKLSDSQLQNLKKYSANII